MFCPECESEYREGFLRCSDCDVNLVAHLGDVPATKLAPLLDSRSAILVAELVERLEQAHIPYVIEAGTALAMLNESAPAIDEPEPWEARVWVPEDFVKAAKEQLDLLRDHLQQVKNAPDWPQSPI